MLRDGVYEAQVEELSCFTNGLIAAFGGRPPSICSQQATNREVADTLRLYRDETERDVKATVSDCLLFDKLGEGLAAGGAVALGNRQLAITIAKGLFTKTSAFVLLGTCGVTYLREAADPPPSLSHNRAVTSPPPSSPIDPLPQPSIPTQPEAQPVSPPQTSTPVLRLGRGGTYLKGGCSGASPACRYVNGSGSGFPPGERYYVACGDFVDTSANRPVVYAARYVRSDGTLWFGDGICASNFSHKVTVWTSSGARASAFSGGV